jgi:hypothetical protein
VKFSSSTSSRLGMTIEFFVLRVAFGIALKRVKIELR